MPRSKKKKKKSTKKADHAHQYERVLVYDPKFSEMYNLYDKCTICGKMSLIRWIFKTERYKEEYCNLPFLNVDKDNVEYKVFPFA